MSDHSIHHPDVVAAIRGTLVNRGVAQQDLGDGLADVQKQLFELYMKKGLGDPGVDQSKALGTRMARDWAVDEIRDASSQKARDEKKHYPQAHALPAERSGEEGLRAQVDHGRTVNEVRKMAQDGTLTKHEVEMLDALASGDKRNKIAQDLGKTPTQLDNDVKKMRRKIVSRLSVAAATLLTLNVVWNQVVVEQFRKKHGIDANGSTQVQARNANVHMNEGPASGAARLRKDAFTKCAQGYWDECQEELDLAYELDPKGQSDPAVQDALWAIRNARQDDLKEREAKPPIYQGPVPQAPKK